MQAARKTGARAMVRGRKALDDTIQKRYVLSRNDYPVSSEGQMEGEITTRPGRPRSEAAKRAILRAALTLLRKHGVAGVTAEAVAERAGVSKATLYRWWPCAAAAAMDAFFEEINSRLPSVTTDAPLEDLRGRARHVARLLGGELGDALAELIATTHTDARLKEVFQERYLRPKRENLRREVDRAIAAGALRDDVDRDV